METKTRGIILFAIALIYYILLNIFSKQVSSTTQIILHVVWVVIFWTLIFWIFRNLTFFKNLLSKFTGFGSFFKYSGYLLFLIFGINAVFALFKYEGSKAWIAFWSYIIFALIFIPIFYWISLFIMNIEKNQWFNRRAIELKAGLILGIVLTIIFLVIGLLAISIGLLVSPESFPKTFTSYLGEMIFMTIPMFIIAFIMGVVIGFISRIYTKVFTGTSKLFEKK